VTEGGIARRVSPLIDKRLLSDFVLIEPARRRLQHKDHLFLQEISADLKRLVEPA